MPTYFIDIPKHGNVKRPLLILFGIPIGSKENGHTAYAEIDQETFNSIVAAGRINLSVLCPKCEVLQRFIARRQDLTILSD